MKVALYVKARFDDLSNASYTYGGKARKLSERWLFTNTKFSDRAIAYGECQGLKLIGWNYPAKDNLHNVLEQNGLHPVTCITLLTTEQKRNLIGRDILFCADVISRPMVLNDIGVKGDEARRVLDEAKMIVETAK